MLETCSIHQYFIFYKVMTRSSTDYITKKKLGQNTRATFKELKQRLSRGQLNEWLLRSWESWLDLLSHMALEVIHFQPTLFKRHVIYYTALIAWGKYHKMQSSCTLPYWACQLETTLVSHTSYLLSPLYHGIVECSFLIGLKGILVCALFPYNVWYICTVEFNGYSSFLHVLYLSCFLKAKVQLKTLLALLNSIFIMAS